MIDTGLIIITQIRRLLQFEAKIIEQVCKNIYKYSIRGASITYLGRRLWRGLQGEACIGSEPDGRRSVEGGGGAVDAGGGLGEGHVGRAPETAAGDKTCSSNPSLSLSHGSNGIKWERY